MAHIDVELAFTVTLLCGSSNGSFTPRRRPHYIFADDVQLGGQPRQPRVIAVRAGHPGMLVHGLGTVDWAEPPAGPAFCDSPVTGRPEYAMAAPEGRGLVLTHRRTVRGAFGSAATNAPARTAY